MGQSVVKMNSEKVGGLHRVSFFVEGRGASVEIREVDIPHAGRFFTVQTNVKGRNEEFPPKLYLFHVAFNAAMKIVGEEMQIAAGLIVDDQE